MKTMTYLLLGATALCGLAVATSQLGQQVPQAQATAPVAGPAQDTAAFSAGATNPRWSRAAALSAMHSPDGAASGPMHPRALAVSSNHHPVVDASRPEHSRAVALVQMRGRESTPAIGSLNAARGAALPADAEVAVATGR